MIRQILIRIREKILEEERKEERRKQLIKSGDYIVSENADVNNILIDTCAINKRGLNIIERSRKVSVLYATLEEIEKKKFEIKRKNNANKFLVNLSKCLNLILQNPNFKVILVENKENEYVDDVVLRYLKHIPKRKRPTLLTADKLLAAKAKGMNIEYICIVLDSQTQTPEKTETKKAEVTKAETKKVETQKIQVLGHVFWYEKGKLKIDRNSNCRDSKVFFIKEGKCEELNLSLNEENIFEKEIDYLVVTKYLPKYKIVKIVKIVFGEEILQEVYECKFVNEIYKLPIHEEVLEKAKNQLAGVTY